MKIFFGAERAQWETGYTVGAGLEYRFNAHWGFRGEYRYMHFKIDRNHSTTNTQVEFDNGGNQTNIFASNFERHSSTNLDFNMGEVGIVYNF